MELERHREGCAQIYSARSWVSDDVMLTISVVASEVCWQVRQLGSTTNRKEKESRAREAGSSDSRNPIRGRESLTRTFCILRDIYTLN